MGKRFVECFLKKRKKRSTLLEEHENANVYFRNTEANGIHQSVSLQSRFSLASWLMVITDDFEHSRKSLFPVPYDQYDI